MAVNPYADESVAANPYADEGVQADPYADQVVPKRYLEQPYPYANQKVAKRHFEESSRRQLGGKMAESQKNPRRS